VAPDVGRAGGREAAGQHEPAARGERDAERQDLRVGVEQRHRAVHGVLGRGVAHGEDRAVRHERQTAVAAPDGLRTGGRARGEEEERQVVVADGDSRVGGALPGERPLEG
jgi:hypothetical protein